MKIILSRKGFDSKAGGIPSPIFPNGDMVSFPIPSDSDNDNYSDLLYKYDNNNYTYTQLLENLYDCRNSQLSRKMLKKLNNNNIHCHLDPDIDKERRISCPDKWEPLFGQINQAGKYLKDNIKNLENEDYLFLFFGWFRKVELQHKNGKLLTLPRKI